MSGRKVDIKHPFCLLQVETLTWEEKLKKQHLEQSVELPRVLVVIMNIYVLIMIFISKLILEVCDLPA